MGFKAISVATRSGSASKVPVGFRGVSVELPNLNLPVSVTDSRGRDLQGVRVVVQNAGVVSSAVTDRTGNALVFSDPTSTIRLIKNNMEIGYTFSFAEHEGETVLILDPPPLL